MMLLPPYAKSAVHSVEDFVNRVLCLKPNNIDTKLCAVLWYNQGNEIESDAMLVASAAMSQYFRGVSTMSDYNPDCVLIPLSKTGKNKGKYTAIVSSEDADLAELSWYVLCSTTQQYATRTIRIAPNVDKREMLHRAVLERKIGRELTAGEYADHINTNGLDNRRINLRLATHAENSRNQSRHKNEYKGASWETKRKKWKAQIVLNGVSHFLGYYDNPEDAHIAYCKRADELFGEFANYGQEINKND